MLTIRVPQMAVFDALQEQRFRATLCADLQREHAALAELSPLVLAWLVDAGIQRARSYGFRFQSSIGLFLHLMAGLAPNFDLQPAIHASLVNPAMSLEDRLEAAAEGLPCSAWQTAEAAASTLGWHLAQDSFCLPTPRRLALALGRALPQDLRGTGADLEALTTACVPQARALGLADDDGLFVFVACERVYGAGWAERLDWARDVFGPDFGSTLRPALLRARLAIDTGAWL